MSEPKPRGRLVMGFSRGDSILVQFADTEVEIKIADDNHSNKVRLVFEAPQSVEIVRIAKDAR